MYFAASQWSVLRLRQPRSAPPFFHAPDFAKKSEPLKALALLTNRQYVPTPEHYENEQITPRPRTARTERGGPRPRVPNRNRKNTRTRASALRSRIRVEIGLPVSSFPDGCHL